MSGRHDNLTPPPDSDFEVTHDPNDPKSPINQNYEAMYRAFTMRAVTAEETEGRLTPDELDEHNRLSVELHVILASPEPEDQARAQKIYPRWLELNKKAFPPLHDQVKGQTAPDLFPKKE